MTPHDHTTPLPLASTAGAQLRAAREAAGLSQEAVAEQLKRAPRQVRAIEEDDYARLPGRTFVRGFVRNYARLVRLDPAVIVAALPRGDGTSPLDRPSLTAVSRPMAELPATSVRRSSWTRWLIPIVLVAVVAAAAVYEFKLNPGALRRPSSESAAVGAAQAPAPATQPSSANAAQSSTPLPNPLEAAKVDTAPAQMEKSDAAPSSAAVSDATLLLTFKEKSWVEVKDGNGAPIFMQMGAAGTTQTLNGMPPLELTIGNAAGVAVTYRGQSIDLAPYTRGNIARFLVK